MVQKCGLMPLSDGRSVSVDDMIINMAESLNLNATEVHQQVLQILSLSDEKEQMTRFRKVLEEAKKKNTEKGVPVHLSIVNQLSLLFV